MMNVRLFSSAVKTTVKFTLLLTGISVWLLCGAGCGLFTSFDEQEEGGQSNADVSPARPLGTISSERSELRKRYNEFICLIADSGKPFAYFDKEKGEWCGIEPDILHALAKAMNKKITFVCLPAPALSAALRKGRGDIAAGKFDTDLIRSLSLTPVLSYAPARVGELAFMTRSDDIDWQNEITRASKNIDLKKIVDAGSNTVHSAKIKLADGVENALPKVSVPEEHLHVDGKGNTLKQ